MMLIAGGCGLGPRLGSLLVYVARQAVHNWDVRNVRAVRITMHLSEFVFEERHKEQVAFIDYADSAQAEAGVVKGQLSQHELLELQLRQRTLLGFLRLIFRRVDIQGTRRFPIFNERRSQQLGRSVLFQGSCLVVLISFVAGSHQGPAGFLNSKFVRGTVLPQEVDFGLERFVVVELGTFEELSLDLFQYTTFYAEFGRNICYHPSYVSQKI